MFDDDPSETTDSDGDGVGDNSDPYPNDPTKSQEIEEGVDSEDEVNGDGEGGFIMILIPLVILATLTVIAIPMIIGKRKKGKEMSRVRLNQEYRNKIANRRSIDKSDISKRKLKNWRKKKKS